MMRADDLEHAVALANQTGYGLTAGLESLDVREQAYWKAHLRAGNLYINRGCTGSMVARQAFGGFKMSGIGRELGIRGLDAYSETKTVTVAL